MQRGDWTKLKIKICDSDYGRYFVVYGQSCFNVFYSWKEVVSVLRSPRVLELHVGLEFGDHCIYPREHVCGMGETVIIRNRAWPGRYSGQGVG